MKWHYGVGNQVHGPVEDKDLLQLVRDRTIGPDTLVWAAFLPNWTPAKDIDGLFKKAGVSMAESAPASSPEPDPKAAPTSSEGRKQESKERISNENRKGVGVSPSSTGMLSNRLNTPLSAGDKALREKPPSTSPTSSLRPQPLSSSASPAEVFRRGTGPLRHGRVAKTDVWRSDGQSPKQAKESGAADVAPAIDAGDQKKSFPVGPISKPSAGDIFKQKKADPFPFSPRPKEPSLETPVGRSDTSVPPENEPTPAPKKDESVGSPLSPSSLEFKKDDFGEQTKGEERGQSDAAVGPFDLLEKSKESPTVQDLATIPPVGETVSEVKEGQDLDNGSDGSVSDSVGLLEKIGEKQGSDTQDSVEEGGGVDKAPESQTDPSFPGPTVRARDSNPPADEDGSNSIPLVYRIALIVAISGGLIYGTQKYFDHINNTILPSESQAPAIPIMPSKRLLSENQQLYSVLPILFKATPDRVTLWDRERVKTEAAWLSEAPSDPVANVIRNPEELPAWIEEVQPVSILVAHSEFGRVAILKLSPEDSDISAHLRDSELQEISGGRTLIPVMKDHSLGEQTPDQGVVFLSELEFVTGDSSTLLNLFESAPEQPSESPEFSELEGHLKKASEKSPVIIARRDAEVPGGWKMSLLRAEADALTHEEVLLDQNGSSMPVFAPGEEPHPDFIFDRVLLGVEIESLKKARRYAQSTFKGSYLMTIPKEMLMGELVDGASAPMKASSALIYLPENFNSVVVHDLKKIRENPLFDSFRADPSSRPHYWSDLNQKIHGILIRDLDYSIRCQTDFGNVQILVARYNLNEDLIMPFVDLPSGYSVKGKMIYPVTPRTAESPHFCLVNDRTALVGAGATLERIIKDPGTLTPAMEYMKELYPEVDQFEESAILRVEGRTADVRYQGVQALVFGELRNQFGFTSRRIIKCISDEAVENFIYSMRRRREDATAAGVGRSVAGLPSIGVRDVQLVIGAEVPAKFWSEYAAYFRNVILPEDS